MVRTEEYLIDKSAHARIWRPELRARWGHEVMAGRVALCAPTEYEILYSARSLQECEDFSQQLRDVYGWVPVPDDVWRSLLDLQMTMARNGCHRSAGAVDMLVALTAQRHQLTVLHYDHDFETIARHVELKTRWAAEPGSIP